jgi:hypothetical protein
VDNELRFYWLESEVTRTRSPTQSYAGISRARSLTQV